MMKNVSSFGTILKLLMMQHNIKPVALADQLDVPLSTINRIINGVTKNPQPETLEKLAKRFNISVDQLCGRKPINDQFEAMLTGVSQDTFIPHIDWDNITTLLKNATPTDRFSVTMSDDSMTPVFSKNSQLTFKVTNKAKNRSFVLVSQNNGEHFRFRQYVIFDDKHYIKTLNNKGIINDLEPVAKTDKVVAILMESRHTYH